ncbi:unnamed protein product [Thlaspi arvense]|uniref:Uncharacterized protein n=1 Tax=Thlaspi arvense TaxID=13288 RepID=A0AAU9SAY5_THLAR|nr:unnamed protein product [Thlaspi arvense]
MFDFQTKTVQKSAASPDVEPGDCSKKRCMPPSSFPISSRLRLFMVSSRRKCSKGLFGASALMKLHNPVKVLQKELLQELPTLVNSMSDSVPFSLISLIYRAVSVATAITTTDLVGGTTIRVRGVAKGSGMIHPSMATS